jgi:hypothetical protein
MLLDPAGARVAPVDCEAVVRANARLSADYHVLTLDAPDVAARTQPGQFVMVKPGRGLDPLLRRPFSVFQILRDGAGAPTGVSILGKIVGKGTALLYALEPGERLACLGPLGRPFTAPPADRPVWFVAGGVGLAPFATLARPALRTAADPSTRPALICTTPVVRRSRRRRPRRHRDGSAGAHGLSTLLGCAHRVGHRPDVDAGAGLDLRLRSDPMMRASPISPDGMADAEVSSSRRWAAAWAFTAAWC